MKINYISIPSPAFVLEEDRLIKNLEIMKRVQEEAGVQIILALKGMAMWSVFPIIKKYLKGATASSLNEALLCYEEMGQRAHTYAPAYKEKEFEMLMRLSSHITFNSLSQFDRFKKAVADYPGEISMGLRVNPEYAEVETDLYNPCAPGSRLGMIADQLPPELPSQIKGLHFHTLCESNSYSLEKTLDAFENRFASYLPQMEWVNMGGGHLMTDSNYHVDHLIRLLNAFKSKYDVEIIMEPGGAVAWQTGELVSTVLDIVENRGIKTLILDVSFTDHMPDTLEMPYRPSVKGALKEVDPKLPTYRLGGLSCLAGDFLDEYSFADPIKVGDRLIFEDMIHYTMVKTTMFNGLNHPVIGIWRQDQQFELVRSFHYLDFKNRLS